MSNVQQMIKRNAYAFSAGLFLLAATVPSIVLPRLASAEAQITERSITMSSSAVSAASQTYKIDFKTATDNAVVQGVVIDFCDSTSSGSPIIGSSNCSLPSGMTVGSTVASVSGLDDDANWTGSTAQAGGNKTLVLTNTGATAQLPEETAVSIEVSGFTNPSNARTFYARVLTYSTNTAANAYTSSTPGTYIDGGGVALSATAAIGVTATVQESLTFCVAGATIDNGCANITVPPSLVLGTGSPKVLDGDGVYTGDVFYQLSTNAVNNTNVRIKGASAGLTSGLNNIPALAGANLVAAAMPNGTTSGNAAFGIRSSGATGGSGTFALNAPYDHSTNFGNDSSAITSTYGSIISHATGAVLNRTVPLTFGATASPTTPAGVYTGSFSLIASSSY